MNQTETIEKLREKLLEMAVLFGVAAETKQDIPHKYAQELRTGILEVLNNTKP
jgi:septum formation topological specificity factor MinE